MEICDNDLNWLAGLLEGEGSFMMGRNWVNGKLYLYPRIVVSMTDADVIERVARLFGTSVYVVPPSKSADRKHYKQQWRAQVNGARAAHLMEQLLPIMGGRRASKIKEILADYGEIEPTEVRRRRSCQNAAALRKRENGKFISSK